MGKLNIKKLGIAVGATGVILYLGCALLMIVLGQQGTISFLTPSYTVLIRHQSFEWIFLCGNHFLELF